MRPALFDYEAIDVRSGRDVRGQETAQDRASVAGLLRAKGLTPVAIRAAIERPAPTAKPAGNRRRGWWRRSTAVGAKELRGFTRQLATLVKAGVPLARALAVIGAHDGHEGLRQLADELRTVIENGGSLSDGLRRRPRLFDESFVAIVTAGETGSVLGDVLARQALVLEKHERMRGRLQAALAYPAVVLVVAGLIVMVLVTIVVPKFALIYGGLLRGQPMPLMTQILLNVSHVLRANALAGAAAVLAAGWIAKVWRGTASGRRILDGWRLQVPWLGDLVVKAAVSRVAGLLGALLESGVDEVAALGIAQAACGNVRLSEAIAEVGARLQRGEGLAGPLEGTGVFPGLVTGMVRVGEETGALPEMLRRVAEAYDEEVDQAVAALAAVVEPLLIVGMALVVGVIVIALFLPMVGVLQHLQ